MFTNLHSFRSRSLSFADALEAHPMMLAPTKQILNQRARGTKAVDFAPLSELWDSLRGEVLQAPVSVMPKCVEWTLPVEYAVVLRRSAGVTTAFAYCELVTALAWVRDLKDDFEVRQAMVAGWRAFEARRQEANDVREGFGCDDSQSWLTMRDIEDQSGAAELKRKMVAIAKLAGRLFESFGYQRKDSLNDAPEEATGATTGGNLDRLLPTELALLGDDDTSDQQAMKILKAQATEIQMQGKESKSRGPLVLVIDESGSMHDGENGAVRGTRYAGRNTWAKACAVALTRIAWSEDRPVVAVHFGMGTEVQEVPKDDYRAMFEMARSFMSGGTNFGSALRSGVAEVGDLASKGFAGADIMLITDGVDHDHAAHNVAIDAMDAQGIKLWTVAIGENIPDTDPVRKRAERYTFATDRQLSDSATATAIGEGLNDAAMGNPPDFTLN